jgi:hypothetical protein
VEWFYIMVSLSCFFSVAYSKLNWPNESLLALMVIMIYPTLQLLKEFKVIELKRFRWSVNLLQLQQKKIRTLKTEIDTLKSDNRLLADEITGLHKIWMNQPGAPKMPNSAMSAAASASQSKKDATYTDIEPLAQLEYTQGVEISEILDKEKVQTDVNDKSEPDHWQETASIDKSPF